MKKLIFINRFFYPDISATSQILTELIDDLNTDDYEINVVTSRQLYQDAKSKLPKTDVYKHAKVIRLDTTSFGRSNILLRLIDYLTFYFSLLIFLMHYPKKGDLLVAKTDPPLLSLIAYIILKFRSIKYINWLQDIFPEVAQNTFKNDRSITLDLIKKLRGPSLKNAEMNIAIGDVMSDFLETLGVSSQKITVIPNWCDGDNIKPIEPSNNYLRKDWHLSDKFVVGYSGNAGRVHEIDTILECAKVLKAYDDIVFLFIGSGSKISDVQKFITDHNLKNILLKPYQPKDLLSYSLAVPDIHLTSLVPSQEGLVVPSKLYGIMAAGRPVINIGSKTGEIARIINTHACGKTFMPEEHTIMADYILELKANTSALNEQSHNARKAFDMKMDKKFSVEKWHALLSKVNTK